VSARSLLPNVISKLRSSDSNMTLSSFLRAIFQRLVKSSKSNIELPVLATIANFAYAGVLKSSLRMSDDLYEFMCLNEHHSVHDFFQTHKIMSKVCRSVIQSLFGSCVAGRVSDHECSIRNRAYCVVHTSVDRCSG
jgi:hypothetical protein